MASGKASFTAGVKVALFVLVLVVGSYFAVRVVSKTGGVKGYLVYTRLRDASGLVVNSRIRMAGIPVGTIESIGLDHGEARIALRVDRTIDLRTNATVARKAASLLGEYQLILTPGTEDQPKIPDGGEISTIVEVATTDKVLQDVSIIAEKIRDIAIQAQKALGTEESGKQMKEILKNLAETSKEINETIRENRKALGQSIKNIESLTEKSIPRITSILKNVEDVTLGVRDVLSTDKKPVAGSGIASIRDTLDRVNTASKSLESTLAHTDSVFGRMDRGEGTVGRLLRSDSLINDVEGVASDLRELTGPIARVQTIVNVRSEYFVRSNGIKSFLELRLQPREDKYYLIELVADPRGATKTSQLDVSSTNPNQPPFYREVRTETTNTFRFSFMLARRLGPATFLFGIRESSGGIGVNLHGFDDRLELRSDLFGFGENVRPRWREHLGFEFMKRIWVVIGADDLLNRDRTDFFVGAQLRFNDEDLKTILPFVSVKP